MEVPTWWMLKVVRWDIIDTVTHDPLHMCSDVIILLPQWIGIPFLPLWPLLHLLFPWLQTRHFLFSKLGNTIMVCAEIFEGGPSWFHYLWSYVVTSSHCFCSNLGYYSICYTFGICDDVISHDDVIFTNVCLLMQ
jgi:hypothetical protein